MKYMIPIVLVLLLTVLLVSCGDTDAFDEKNEIGNAPALPPEPEPPGALEPVTGSPLGDIAEEVDK